MAVFAEVPGTKLGGGEAGVSVRWRSSSVLHRNPDGWRDEVQVVASFMRREARVECVGFTWLQSSSSTFYTWARFVNSLAFYGLRLLH